VTRRAATAHEACRSFALGLPGAWEDQPWADGAVVKVRKKIFAFLGGPDSTTVSVKLPESAEHALSLPCAGPTSYGLGRHGWVTVDLGGQGAPATELILDWVEESYRAVAPKVLVRALDTGSFQPGSGCSS
jgi:predicted DNA-binding protein (MmcQ/YjbR family)